MAQVTPLYTSGNAGEWSRDLWGRPDLQKYPNARKTLQNMIPLIQGPQQRRSGSRLVGTPKDNKSGMLVPFEFSTVQAYILEMTDLLFRFYMNRTLILSGGTPYEVVHPYTLDQLAQIKWAQSADVLYLWHPAVKPQKVTRTAHTSWTIAPINFLDGPYLNTNITATTLTPGAATGLNITLTASSVVGINGGLGFQASTDIGRLVRLDNGANWGWAEIISVTSTTVARMDIKSNFAAATATAAWRLGAWSNGLGWPTCGVFHEERLWHGGSSSQPQTLWASVTADFENMAPTDLPGSVLDDSAITRTAIDNQVNAIRWLESATVLRIGTAGGEKIAAASNQQDFMTPSNMNVRPQSTRKVFDAMPVKCDDAVLFIQRARRKLYEQLYQFEPNSYVSGDTTKFSRHITAGKLLRLAYQAEPYSCIWAIHDDGSLVSFTYAREEQVFGWARQPIAGRLGNKKAKVISIAAIPGADYDEVYLLVERTIDGATLRTIEVLENDFEELNAFSQDYMFYVDAGLTYDGWNIDATKTLTIAGGAYGEGGNGTIEAIGHTPFSGADIGRQYRFRDLDSGLVVPVIVEIDAVTDSSHANVTFKTAIPAVLQALPVSYWGRAVSGVTGLDHLEGETVQACIDGVDHPDQVVAAGAVTFDRQAVVAHVGLGFESITETLDVEPGSLQGSSRGKQKKIPSVAVSFASTLGCTVEYADQIETLTEDVEFHTDSELLDLGPRLFTGDKLVKFPKSWDQQLRVKCKQSRPLAMKILAIAPTQTVNEG